MTKVCTIRILDEVNVKLEGLDVATRRKCSNKLKFQLPYARYMPAYRLGRWDGSMSFFSVGGQTQINLLDRVLPIIEDEGYQVELIDTRPVLDIDLKEIDKDVNANVCWASDHSTHSGKPIVLREHQVNLINDFLKNPQSIVTAPTGAGKTLAVATLSKIVEPYGRTIIIVPNKSLVEQTLADYLLLGLDAGVYYGDQKDWNKKHTICTWQSLEKLVGKSKNGELEEDETIHAFIKDVIAIVVDEAQTCRGEVLRKLLTGIFRNIPLRWGLTGTIPKQEYEQVGLISCIGQIIYGVTSSELQEKGILSNCDIEIIQTQEKEKFGSYAEENKFLTSNKKRLRWLSEEVIKMAEDGNTLVLVNRVATGRELETLIPNSVFVDGSMKVSDRKEEYDIIATDDNRVIIATFGVAAVGLNIPRIYSLALIEPGKSFIKVIQSIGRGLRRAKDKDFVKIYDICSATKYSKRHLTERKRFYQECAYPFKVVKKDTE